MRARSQPTLARQDGRFLMAAERYDELHASGGGDTRGLRLARVHPAFRVIAVGVPVPPFAGSPLEPGAGSAGSPQTESLHSCADGKP